MTTATITETRTTALDVARRLAGEFRDTAAEYDRTGEFPFAHYDRMRDEGYLRAIVPIELGGLGAGLLDMARAQQALARGCASTALAVNMHHFQLGAAADDWRNGKPTEGPLRRVVDEGIVLGSTGAEAIVAGQWDTDTVARRDDGQVRISGRKYFCSQAPAMDVVRVNARDEDSGEILVIAIPMNVEGVSYEETWDTTGMRATASHDLILDDVVVPESAIAGSFSASGPLDSPAMAGAVTWFLTLASSVYLGVAEEARDLALLMTGSGRNSSFRDQALTDMMIGEMETEFQIALSVRDQIAAELDQDRNVIERAVAQATLLKEVVTEHAIKTVDKAVELAGGRAFFRKSPLERLARDVRAGRFHPPSSPVSFQIVGSRRRRQAAQS